MLKKNNEKKLWKSYAMFQIFILSLCFFMDVTVYAKVSSDSTRLCSLSVELPEEYNELKNSDLEIKLYKVADLDYKFKYVALGKYEDLNNYTYSYLNDENKTERINVKLSDVDGGTTAKEWEGLTFKAIEIAKSESPTATEKLKIDMGKFEKITPGLYLVMVDNKVINEKTYKFMLSLVSVPGFNENNSMGEKMEYDVKSELKIEVMDNGTSNPGTTKVLDGSNSTTSANEIKVVSGKPIMVKKGMLPQTGQLKWAVPVFVFVGIILITGGVILLKKDKRNE